MPLYTFIHNLLNVLVQIADKMGLQKQNFHVIQLKGFTIWDAAVNRPVDIYRYSWGRGEYFKHFLCLEGQEQAQGWRPYDSCSTYSSTLKIGTMFLRNVGPSANYTTLKPDRQYS
jgi:hypothetical protein